MVKKCKIYQSKGSKGSPAPWDLVRKFALGGRWDIAVFENLPRTYPGVGNA